MPRSTSLFVAPTAARSAPPVRGPSDRTAETSSHLVEQEVGWGALAHDLLDRKWKLPERLPPVDEARRELARLVLAAAGELTAADLSGVLVWRRRLAADVLDEVAPARVDGDFRIWAAP